MIRTVVKYLKGTLDVDGTPKPFMRGKIHLLMAASVFWWGPYMVQANELLLPKITAWIASFSFFFCFFASAIFHNFPWSHQWNQFFQKIDHIGIFFMISGSTCPLLLHMKSYIRIICASTQWISCLIGSILILSGVLDDPPLESPPPPPKHQRQSTLFSFSPPSLSSTILDTPKAKAAVDLMVKTIDHIETRIEKVLPDEVKDELLGPKTLVRSSSVPYLSSNAQSSINRSLSHNQPRFSFFGSGALNGSGSMSNRFNNPVNRPSDVSTRPTDVSYRAGEMCYRPSEDSFRPGPTARRVSDPEPETYRFSHVSPPETVLQHLKPIANEKSETQEGKDREGVAKDVEERRCGGECQETADCSITSKSITPSKAGSPCERASPNPCEVASPREVSSPCDMPSLSERLKTWNSTDEGMKCRTPTIPLAHGEKRVSGDSVEKGERGEEERQIETVEDKCEQPSKYHRGRRATVYVLMGFLNIIFMPEIIRVLTLGELSYILVLALLYVIGATVYAFKYPDPLPFIWGYHEIFHCFCLSAAIVTFNLNVAVLARYSP